jgi:hypothetical protein
LLRRHPAIIAEGLTGAWLRGLGATALMAGVCWLIATGLRHELGSGRLIDLVTIILAGGGGALAYVLVMWLTGKDEVALLRQSLRRSPP